ncbi:MAG: hypothetical protein K1Y36_17885 [Blastocatellia bacterium]|nr:hypothetical protein [Blastocatellia bacterium]
MNKSDTVPISLRIQLVSIEGGESFDWGMLDLADQQEYYDVILALGNGIFDEVRVVAEAKEGILYFQNLLGRGGYKRDLGMHIEGRQLYQAGDVGFPAGNPFVFLAPLAQNGETVDFDRLEQEIEELCARLEKLL